MAIISHHNSVSLLQWPKVPRNFNEWLRWLHIYASIFTANYPEEAPQIFTYISKILQFYQRSPNTYTWRVYDELFRGVRQLAHDEPWHMTNDELYRQAEDICSKPNFNHNKSYDKFDRNSRDNKQGRDPSKKTGGFCFDFNSVKGCTRRGCSYSHTCASCKGNHSIVRCAKAKEHQEVKGK